MTVSKVLCTIWKTLKNSHTSPIVKNVPVILSQACGNSTYTRSENPLKWSYVHGPSDVRLLGSTVGQLLQDRAQNHPDRLAVVMSSSNERRTFAELLQDSDKLAAGLTKLGVKTGDRVGIWGPNSLEWIITKYAAARAGFILVNINPMYKSDELEYVLKKVECKALISASVFRNQNYYDTLFQLFPELASHRPEPIHSHLLPHFKILVMMGEKQHPGAYRFSDVMEMATDSEQKAIYDMQGSIQFDQPFNIQFTSGTTGYPKGVVLTHHNVTNNATFIGRYLDLHKEASVMCTPAPLFHAAGMVISSMMTPTHGATCVLPASWFDAGLTLEAIDKERCTALFGVPTMFIDMVHHPDVHKYDLSSLRAAMMGGSPCPVETLKQIEEKMGVSEVTVLYGLTETSATSFQSHKDDPLPQRVQTVGRVHPQLEAKIIDEDGMICRVGEQGEICIRGYSVMQSYWNDPDKTAQAIGPDRWLHTGDVGKMDRDGFCTITGRIKDMIIRGGENVYPVEIENLLHKHPKIKAAQVVGVPDKRLGEEICAWINLVDGTTATEKDIKEFCNEKIARFKIPKYIQFVDGFPLTVSGKVQKFKIRELATTQLGLDHLV